MKKKVFKQGFYADRNEISFYENHKQSTIINESIPQKIDEIENDDNIFCEL